MKDQMNVLHTVVAIAPVVVTDNTAQASSIIDRKGYDALTFAILLGTLADADATFAVTMTHGDDSGLSDGAAVGADDIIGTLALAGFTFADDGETRKVGYRGIKRYVRLTITPTNNAGNAPMAALAILGNPAQAPTPNPPQ